jgi:hypothetical protein
MGSTKAAAQSDTALSAYFGVLTKMLYTSATNYQPPA